MGEVHDGALLERCGSTEFTLVLRSKACAEWLEQFAKNEACLLKDACEEVRSNKECMLAAAKVSEINGAIGSLVSSLAMCDDKEVVMAAVQMHGLCLFAATPRLRRDPEVALAAIRKDRESLMAVLEPVRSDPAFLRHAYWTSSLDSKKEDKSSLAAGLAKAAWHAPVGTPETWEEILGQGQGRVQRALWSILHNRLRCKESTCITYFMTFWNWMLITWMFPQIPNVYGLLVASFPLYQIAAATQQYVNRQFVSWVVDPSATLHLKCRSEIDELEPSLNKLNQLEDTKEKLAKKITVLQTQIAKNHAVIAKHEAVLKSFQERP